MEITTEDAQELQLDQAIKMARDLHEQGKLEEAFNIYAQINEQKPENAEVHHLMALILSQTSQHARALPHAQKSVQLNPESANFHNTYGVILQEMFKFEDSIIHFKKSLELSPNTQRTYYNLGESLRKIGKFEEAIQSFEKSLDFGKMTKSFSGASLAFLALGKMKEAESLAIAAIKENAQDETSQYAMARVHFMVKQNDSAEKFCKSALDIKPNYTEALDLLALISAAKGDIKKSEQIFENLITRHPNFASTHFNYAATLISQKNRIENADKILALLQRAADLAPNSALYSKVLAAELYSRNRLDEAFSYYENSYKFAPNDDFVICNYGSMLFQEKLETDLAIQVLEKGVNQHPQKENILFNLINAYVSNNDFEKALNFARIFYEQNANHHSLEKKFQEIINSGKSKLSKKDINFLISTTHRHQTPQILTVIGSGLFFLGDIAEAMNFRYKQIITHLAHQITDPQTMEEIDFNNDKPEQSLIELKKLLYSNNINFFLVFGTLLGAIRENAFLSHDKDIDVGILTHETSQEKLAEVIEKDGNFKLIKQYNNKQKEFNLVVRHKKFKTGIDIFMFNKGDNGKLITGTDHPTEPLIWEFEPFSLKKHTFLNEEFFIPNQPEKHLEEIYGPEWRIPDDSFDTIISAYNLAEKNASSFALEVSRLNEALKKGKFKRALKICKILKENDFDNHIIEMVETYVGKML